MVSLKTLNSTDEQLVSQIYQTRLGLAYVYRPTSTKNDEVTKHMISYYARFYLIIMTAAYRVLYTVTELINCIVYTHTARAYIPFVNVYCLFVYALTLLFMPAGYCTQ